MRPKFTDWYPPDSKPIRKGYYQRKHYPGVQGLRQAYWSGKFWKTGELGLICLWQDLPWRGLTEASYHAAIRRV